MEKIICIIDDDGIFQLLTKRLIDKILTNYRVLQFENGRLAMDFFEQNLAANDRLPQLIFIDINMPVMNGWQFLDMFGNFKTATYTPVIYMSSSSSDQFDITRANSYEFLSGYLIKPIAFSQMSLLIRTVYEGFVEDSGYGQNS